MNKLCLSVDKWFISLNDPSIMIKKIDETQSTTQNRHAIKTY